MSSRDVGASRYQRTTCPVYLRVMVQQLGAWAAPRPRHRNAHRQRVGTSLIRVSQHNSSPARKPPSQRSIALRHTLWHRRTATATATATAHGSPGYHRAPAPRAFGTCSVCLPLPVVHAIVRRVVRASSLRPPAPSLRACLRPRHRSMAPSVVRSLLALFRALLASVHSAARARRFALGCVQPRHTHTHTHTSG